jgi:hypothetical protein
MATTLKLIQVQENEDSVTLIAQLTLSGNYANPGGDNIDFTTLIGQSSSNGRIFIASSPALAILLTSANGFIVSAVPGAALNLNAFFAFSAVNVQQNTGAYPANLLTDMIILTATFTKFF